jgi:putative transposase
VDRRADADWLREQYGASERRVCELMSIAVSSYRYRSRRSDETLRESLVRLAREKPLFGYRRLQDSLDREGERVNHKRVYRLYRELGLFEAEKAQTLQARWFGGQAAEGFQPGMGA